MGRDLLIALCLWSCTLSVNCEFSAEAVKKVTDHVRTVTNLVFGSNPLQFAYIVKLTEDECIRNTKGNPGLITEIPQAFFNAINQEKNQHLTVMKNTINNHGIYSGDRMMMAPFRDVLKHEEIFYTDHAEYRLLFQSDIQNFLNRAPVARCVIFYSLDTPCVSKCLNAEGNYYILKGLGVFKHLQDTAFVYNKVFYYDRNRFNTNRHQIINSWGNLNNIMTLFRCYGNYNNYNCQKCFVNNDIIPYCTQ